MTRILRLLFPVGVIALLCACDQPAPTGLAATEDIAVLPGTETSRDFGDYVVHFNALRTDQLTPAIAAEYQIVRSQSRVLLNVSILQKTEGGMTQAVSGAVAASAINLSAQLKGIAMREVREENAIYYIGELGVTNAETLIFTVDVTPLNEPSRFTVRFKKQFFVD